MNPPSFFGPRPTYYNSPLLDELHFHFPAILYEPDMFRSVHDLLGYIQSQMRLRYDLFSVAQQQYQPAPRAWRGGAGAPIPPRQTEELRVTMETEGGGTIQMLNALLGVAPPRTRAVGNPLQDLLQLMQTGGVGGAAGAGGAAGILEPVIVRPTAQQIDTGTSIEVLDAEEETCAICQDLMHAGEEVRAINACDHRFHRNCIDTWFQRNVRCPVCRHDVREPVADEDMESVDSEGMD